LGVATIDVAAPALTVFAVAGVIVPLAEAPGVRIYEAVAMVKVGVIVAFPESVTVVEALVALAKLAFAAGFATQPENA
jgi:hypothetical protein